MNSSDQSIGALPSALSKRSKPSVPPASALYEPLIKHVLTRRFTSNVLGVTAVASWIAAALWIPWSQGNEASGLLKIISYGLSIGTIVQAAGLWMLGSVPVAVIRRIHIKSSRSSALTPYQAFCVQFSQNSYRQALLVLTASSLLLASCHALVSQAGRNDVGLGLWAGSKKHPLHLNGRLVYLFTSQLCAAVVYWSTDILKDRFTIRWNRHSQLDSSTMLPYALSSIVSSLLLSSISTLLSLLSFAMLRTAILPVVYRLPIVHGLLRPFVAHFLRPQLTVTFLWSNFNLVIRASALAFSTHLTWDITATLFDYVFAVPAFVSDVQKDHLLSLVSGISSTNPYFQLHAFHELCFLSSDSARTKDKRIALFADSKYNPPLWASVVRQCLLLLGRDYQVFLRRGNPVATAPVPAPPAPIKKNLVQSVIRAPIYKPATPSSITRLVESLSSNSPANATLSQVVDKGLGISDVMTVSPPLSSLTTVKKLESSANAAISSNHPQALLKRVEDHAKIRAFTEWWTRPRKDREAYKALPNKELDTMIAEALSTLVACSLHDDAFGNVQRDIPKILEALVSFLIALEEYHLELSTSLSALRASKATAELSVVEPEISRAEEWIDSLASAIRTGIALIVHEFDDRLMSFKFPIKIASKLQNFVDYST